jgi:serine/threonine protein kinase
VSDPHDDSIDSGSAPRGDDDAALADWIEAEGRDRIRRGLPVTLERYLCAFPDLLTRPISLDAAIDVALRSLSGSARISPTAVDELRRTHPEFDRQIREAAMLNATVWSTTGLRASVDGPPPKPLPCEFGPPLAGGQQRYQLQQLLGQGGFGQVYLALDRQLSEEGHTALVAIKILSVARRSPSVRARLIEEATKVRRISHPNVVMVLDRGVTEQDEDYIVYEYAEGGDLTTIAAAHERMPIRNAAKLMAQIARGVHAAHSAGVIHCDLKPGNIMLTAKGQPKVADFGIAVRLQEAASDSGNAWRGSGLAAGGPIGNVAFISPEQFRREDHALTVQSDVYALGGILFLMLTGELPNGSTTEAITRTHDLHRGRTTPPLIRPLRPEVDRDLESICRRAMAVNVHERYSSAAAFAEDLERWLALKPISWTRPGVARTTWLWARRKPALAASVAIIIALAITGSAVALHFASVARENALAAALAQMQADQEEALRLRSKALANQFAQSLMVLREYRISTEALLTVWALEYIYGPEVLGLTAEREQLWKARIVNLRHLVASARAEGRGDELETLLWESALAFWLVNAKDHEEAEPLLEQNILKWNRRLMPGDRWLNDLKAMRTAASVNRLAAFGRERQLSADELAEAARCDTALREACGKIPSDHLGTPIHYLILNALSDLCAEELLNQPDRRRMIQSVMKTVVDHKPAPDPCP